MSVQTTAHRHADKLLFFGISLFLLGLLIGLCIPLMPNPRMGLSAHLEGIMNGLFLLVLGLIWHKIAVSDRWRGAAYWLALYGSFANLVAVTLAAITGGGAMMPIAGGKVGSAAVESVVSFLLVSLSLAMIAVCAIALAGLYHFLRIPAQPNT